MRMASDVPAGTLTLTAGGGGPAIMALFGSGAPFAGAGAPTGVTTGFERAGFGPGAGGVMDVVTCCVCPEAGGATVMVLVSPLASTYCPGGATPAYAAYTDA